jgi:hypothetical protein
LCETTSVTWRSLQPFPKRFSRKPIYVPNMYMFTFSRASRLVDIRTRVRSLRVIHGVTPSRFRSYGRTRVYTTVYAFIGIKYELVLVPGMRLWITRISRSCTQQITQNFRNDKSSCVSNLAFHTVRYPIIVPVRSI